MGVAARRAAADLKAALALAVRDRAPPDVLTCSSSTGDGIPELIEALAGQAKAAQANHSWNDFLGLILLLNCLRPCE